MSPARIWVTDVRLEPARRRDCAAGLVGFVSCTINGMLRLDGLALRRTRDGRHSITLPRRHGHPIVRPLQAAWMRELEAQVFEALGLEAAS
jgi:hypothetical protein